MIGLYPMMTYPLPVAHKLPIKTLVAWQLRTTPIIIMTVALSTILFQTMVIPIVLTVKRLKMQLLFCLHMNQMTSVLPSLKVCVLNNIERQLTIL